LAEESDHSFESNTNQNEQNLSQFLLSLENILSLDKDRNRLLEVCGQESTLLFSQTFPKKFVIVIIIISGSNEINHIIDYKFC
jgi:hypothetical protein